VIKAAALVGVALMAMAGQILGSAPAMAAGVPGAAAVHLVGGATRVGIPATGAVMTPSAAQAASMAAVPGSQLWVARYVGDGDGGQARGMALSPDGGTVFVAGDGSSPASGSDFATVAYDAATGRRLWASSYNGPASAADLVHGVGVSPDGKTVFVTGQSMGSNPAVTGYLTVAYNAATGAQLWVRRYTGALKRGGIATALAVSPSGSAVFVTGTSFASPTGEDYTTIAYNPVTGAQLWVKRYNGPDATFNDDQAAAVAVSPDGSMVFVTGKSIAVKSTNDPDYDYTTIAYGSATGSQVWIRRYDKFGPDDSASAVAVSPDGKAVFITGTSGNNTPETDYATVAYRAGTGAQLWVARYNGPDSLNDGASSVAVNPDGTAVYVTGHSAGSVSFADYATIAYDTTTGAQLWAARYNGPPNEGDMANSAGVSADGRTVYVTGVGAGTVVTGGYTIEATTIAYNTATGASRWIRRYPGIANINGGAGCCVAVSAQGPVYVSGWAGAKTRDDLLTVAYDG